MVQGRWVYLSYLVSVLWGKGVGVVYIHLVGGFRLTGNVP